MNMNNLIHAVILALILFAAFIVVGSVLQAHAISILTLGDISCSAESLKTMDNIIAYLQTHHVDRLVFLGDSKYGASWETCTEHFFIQVKQYTVLRMVWGNHENDTFANLIEPQFNKLVWNETVGNNTLLLGMNTNKEWNITSKQYQQVINILDTNIAEYKFVFMHKHSIDACRPDKDPFMCNFYELYAPVWKKYKVDCVVSGHLHMIAMLTKDGVCYGIYGMGGAQPYAIHHTFFGSQTLYKSTVEHGFVVLDETPTGMMHAFYTNNGDLIRKHYVEK